MNAKVKGFIAGILAAVFYGTNPLGALPLYADGLTSSTVLFYRYGLAVVMFSILMLARGENFRIRWGHAIKLASLGVIFALSSLTLFLSFHYMDAGIASSILFCYPIITAVLMTMFFHERVTWTTTLSITLAVLGIALLYHGDGEANVSKLGFALVMLSSLLYAMYIVAVNQLNKNIFKLEGPRLRVENRDETDDFRQVSSLKFTFWVVLFGWITIVVYAFLAGENIQMLHGVKQWAFATQLALLPTVLSLFLMTIAIKNIGSTPAAIMGALEPVTAVAIGVCLFGEAFTPRLAGGIFLILCAVTLIVLHKDKQKQNKDVQDA